MAGKSYDHYGKVGKPSEKNFQKKKRPKLIAVIDEDNCTGCQVCVPFCPSECIKPVPREKYGLPIPPLQVNFHQCIGCQQCMKACSNLTWDAIRMFDVEDFEARFGITITNDTHAPEAALEPAE